MHVDIRRVEYPYTQTELVPGGGQVIAIGDFDGVHLGHQEVIGRAVQEARSLVVPSAIMTFDPHPREVLGKPQFSRYITPIAEKMRLFAELGIDHVYIVRFTEQLAQVSPEEYFERMLLPMHLKAIVVGFDFTFGHKGLGTAETLVRLADDRMRVHIVPPYHMYGEKVSSTLIREQLHLGELDRLRQLLGRRYRIEGTVVRGEGRGRTIGFPTANLELADRYVIPRQGVYAVKVSSGTDQWNGVMNIGTKPTFHGDEGQLVTIEVHLFDCNEDLYGRTMQVEFAAYLRPEMKFSSVDLLIEQIRNDAMKARQILA